MKIDLKILITSLILSLGIIPLKLKSQSPPPAVENFILWDEVADSSYEEANGKKLLKYFTKENKLIYLKDLTDNDLIQAKGFFKNGNLAYELKRNMNIDTLNKILYFENGKIQALTNKKKHTTKTTLYYPSGKLYIAKTIDEITKIEKANTYHESGKIQTTITFNHTNNRMEVQTYNENGIIISSLISESGFNDYRFYESGALVKIENTKGINTLSKERNKEWVEFLSDFKNAIITKNKIKIIALSNPYEIICTPCGKLNINNYCDYLFRNTVKYNEFVKKLNSDIHYYFENGKEKYCLGSGDCLSEDLLFTYDNKIKKWKFQKIITL